MSRSMHNASRRTKSAGRTRRVRQDFTRAVARADFDSLASYVPSRAMRTAI